MPLIFSMLTKPAPSPTTIAAGRRQCADRVEAALGDRLGAGRHGHAALEQPADERVGAEGLELALRVEVAVLPVEAQDQADGHGLLAQRVEEAAAEDAAAASGSPACASRGCCRTGSASGNWTIAFMPSEKTCGFGAAAEAARRTRCESTPCVPSARIVTAARISSARDVVALRRAVGAQAHLGEADALHGAVLDDQRPGGVAVVDLDAQLRRPARRGTAARRETEMMTSPVWCIRDGTTMRRDPVRALRAQEVSCRRARPGPCVSVNGWRDLAPAGQQVVEDGRLERGARQHVVARRPAPCR